MVDGRDDGRVPPDDERADDEEWAVTLEDLADDGGPAPLEPGDVDPEHAAFVLLGAAVTVVAFLLVVL